MDAVELNVTIGFVDEVDFGIVVVEAKSLRGGGVMGRIEYISISVISRPSP